jgi:hypothetical protein
MTARDLERARRAGARAARRPRRDVAAVLAAAARRWRDDTALRDELPAQASLHPATIAAAVALAADALDADSMLALVDRELCDARPTRPWLVVHVLASNVPALALPAIALTCLAGAAVVVKSGRADRVSAPAFRRALEGVDPDLAESVVTSYWVGGDAATEDPVLRQADRIVASGHDATIASLARRLDTRLIGHGERASVVVLGRDALDTRIAADVAVDVAMHDQRGCLSPHAVYVAGPTRPFADDLAAALATVATALPPGPLDDAARAAHRTALATAEWEGAVALGDPAGTVLVSDAPAFRPTPGRRTVWVRPLAALADAIPAGRIECVGAAGAELDPAVLRALGVARVCPPGRMQRPPLIWPRGQHAPLRSLLDLPAEPRLLVEAT